MREVCGIFGERPRASLGLRSVGPRRPLHGPGERWAEAAPPCGCAAPRVWSRLGNVGRAFRGPVCLSQEVLSQESPRQSLVKLRLEAREQSVPLCPGGGGVGLSKWGQKAPSPHPCPAPTVLAVSVSVPRGQRLRCQQRPTPRGADWAAVPVMRGGSGSRGGEPGAGSVGGTCTVAVAPALAVAVAPAPAAPVPAGRGTASSKWTRGHSRIAAAPGPRQLPHVPGGQVARSGQGGLCQRWLCG